MRSGCIKLLYYFFRPRNKKGARFAKARETVAFLLALSGSRQTNRLRLLGRYRMARISQSASLYELASWMRPQKSLAKWFVVSERLLQRIDESASIFETYTNAKFSHRKQGLDKPQSTSWVTKNIRKNFEQALVTAKRPYL